MKTANNDFIFFPLYYINRLIPCSGIIDVVISATLFSIDVIIIIISLLHYDVFFSEIVVSAHRLLKLCQG